MSRNLYNLAGYLLLPIMLLRLLFKGIKTPAYRRRIRERLGLITQIPVPTIWVHCVSVGEFHAAIVLIDKLIEHYPEHRVLVTSTTPTGSHAIKKHYQSAVLHFYFPFDLPIIVNQFIKRINAKICILLETEIWPNLIQSLNQQNVPSLLVNARLSKRSLKRYQKFVPELAKQTLNNLNVIATQNQNSANRFIALGAFKDKVSVAGNIKFDQNLVTDAQTSKALQKIIIPNKKVVVFASTHPGEEEQIINAYLTHKDNIDALLVIIPRHPERFNEVYKLAQKRGINISKRSSNQPCTSADMLLGDSMGEMMSYFELADVVFMGGSLSNTGGHNMLEPAALSKPILFGKNVFNFAEISADLLSQNAAIQVQNADDLFQQITLLLNDQKKADDLGANAKEYFESKQGAVDNLIKQINVILS